jgi:hypothetical protein
VGQRAGAGHGRGRESTRDALALRCHSRGTAVTQARVDLPRFRRHLDASGRKPPAEATTSLRTAEGWRIASCRAILPPML